MSTASLTQNLKELSQQIHNNIDNLVMSKKPFDSIANYSKFLQAQQLFHKAATPVYHNTLLSQHIADLASLSRLSKIHQDMQDLGIAPFDSRITVPSFDDMQAIGWFYCLEGSNVGAAILYKEAGKIDLNDNFGARHLAAHPEGRMPHWRAIKSKLDAITLNEEQQERAFLGCNDAFNYFGQVLQEVYE